MNRAAIVPALIVFAATILVTTSACGPNQGAYIAANEAIIDQLPLFPGAVEQLRESNSYTFEDGGPLDALEGYGTRVTYRVPDGTTQSDLLEFYGGALASDWQVEIETIPTVGIAAPPPPSGSSSGATPPASANAPVATPLATAEPALDPVRVLHLCRGQSLVSISSDNLPHNSTFDLYVDHSYAQDGQRTAC